MGTTAIYTYEHTLSLHDALPLSFLAPILTGWRASKVFGTDAMPSYKIVFIAAGIGMLISLVWFWFGRKQLLGIGRPIEGEEQKSRVLWVFIGALQIGRASCRERVCQYV